MPDQPLTKLVDQASRLSDEVGRLSLFAEQLGRRTDRGEKLTLGVVFGLILDLILSVVVALTLVNLFGTNDDLQETITREQKTRQEALCPLYNLIVGSFNPESRQPGPAREAYEEAFRQLRVAREALDCTGALVPRVGG